MLDCMLYNYIWVEFWIVSAIVCDAFLFVTWELVFECTREVFSCVWGLLCVVCVWRLISSQQLSVRASWPSGYHHCHHRKLTPVFSFSLLSSWGIVLSHFDIHHVSVHHISMHFICHSTVKTFRSGKDLFTYLFIGLYVCVFVLKLLFVHHLQNQMDGSGGKDIEAKPTGNEKMELPVLTQPGLGVTTTTVTTITQTGGDWSTGLFDVCGDTSTCKRKCLRERIDNAIMRYKVI